MKYIQANLFFLFIIYCPQLWAQQNHFVYIQTESKNPFYVRLDKKILSSSTTGYLIISKLKDGNCSFTIGFPKNEWDEQNFTCLIDKRDKGFILKNFGNKGWGLFNLQTLDISMASTYNKKTDVNEMKTDEFSTKLSNVVHDPSIKQIETFKESSQISEEKNESNTNFIPNMQIDKNNISLISNIDKNPGTKSVIKKTIGNKKVNGQEIVYIDDFNGQQDTIIILIPLNNTDLDKKLINNIEDHDEKQKKKASETIVENNIELSNKELNAEPSIQNQVIIETDKQNVKFLDIEFSKPKTSDTNNIVIISKEIRDEPLLQKSQIINSDCKNAATDEDFLKLNKKMTMADNEDDKILIAKKNFKSKCFTTDQIKNLSKLFIKDSDKYGFFDTAYPFTSDSANFKSLESQLTDPYYVNRFKVMIRH